MYKFVSSAPLSLDSRVGAVVMASCLALACGPAFAADPDAANREGSVLRPLVVERFVPQQGSLQVKMDREAYAALKGGPPERRLEFPISPQKSLVLELERFDVTTPDTRFVSAGADGQVELAAPDVVMFRGQVAGEPRSRAFVALTADGGGNGEIILESGERYILSADSAAPGGKGPLTVHQATGGGLPDFTEFCGMLHLPEPLPQAQRAASAGPLLGGPRLVHVAVEADQAYVQLFDDVDAAASYVVQLIGAVSDIYIRDLDVRLVLASTRLWAGGGAPFGADDIEGFASYWLANEDKTGIEFVHLFSGRRDTWYAGMAYLSGPCDDWAFGISAFMNGSFPTPVEGPDLGNFDVIVVAHEMGHNMGSGHTHDGYIPQIDRCTSGVHERGTIMSYCHTNPGGVLNMDMRFHGRVQQVIESYIWLGGCLLYDCNGNNVDDFEDIAALVSADVNGNGVPDECEDCNGNGVLDTVDIAGDSTDADSNNIPDECEPDCNDNGVPDEWDILPPLGESDLNGNRVPDQCDPDCDANGTPDFTDIWYGVQEDLNRNSIPDVCDDCNGNGVTDWIELEREFNAYVADLGNFVREYLGASGVPIQSLAEGVVNDPFDIVFGADRQAYVASFGDDRIVRIDVDLATASEFVSAGVGGLDGPAGLTFGPNGNLFVSSRWTSSVIEYDGSTGTPVGTFVAAGSGGLTEPFGLEFGPNGNLFVTSSDNSVLEYSGIDGSFVGAFVSPGSGGLDGPRGMAFKPDGNLLVASHYNDSIMEYDASGASVGIFNDAYIPWGAWGLRIGLRGNVFVVQHTGSNRILEYDISTGHVLRSYIRGDLALSSPTGLAFRPGSAGDCDGNFVPDECDPDCNNNGYGDGCDILVGTSDDCDENGIPDDCDLANGTSFDCNNNDVIDECDLANGTSFDCNATGVPDECESDCNGNGLADECELDTDSDGVIDDCDLCPLDSQDDRDGDGACDSDEQCPDDPNKQTVGRCGCGIADYDDDGDDIADCNDACPGVNDAVFGPECVGEIPTTSVWGVIVLALLLITGAKIRFGRPRRGAA